MAIKGKMGAAVGLRGRCGYCTNEEREKEMRL